MRSASGFALELSLLREQVASSDLLPAAYARYRPLLADGLHFFLQRLPAGRLRRIFAEQMRLPVSASTAERLVALLHHVPALHKLGQVVARDRRLRPGFRRRLQQLESLKPRASLSEVMRLLDREFKPWRKASIRLGSAPLAEGSVAVVMPFSWQDHSSDETVLPGRPRARSRNALAGSRLNFEDGDENEDEGRHEGVFKLLKPGIKGLLDEDLEILGRLGDYLDEDCARYHLPQMDYRDTFETIRELLLHEVKLEEEQRHLAAAVRNYASIPAVLIPALFPFCSANLTAMERVHGEKITRGALPQGISRPALARVAAQALVAQPLFSPQAAAPFHADPHAGNLLVTADGRLALLDWSLTGQLRRHDRVEIVRLLVGALTLDVGGMGRAVAELAQNTPKPRAIEGVLRASLRQVRWGTFPGIKWLTELLDRLIWQAGVRFAGDLLLFRKVLLTLEGVLADLLRADGVEPQIPLDEVVLGAFLQHWAAEWPDRLQAPLTARSATTHLSTADLLALAWSAPLTMARWWTGVME